MTNENLSKSAQNVQDALAKKGLPLKVVEFPTAHAQHKMLQMLLDAKLHRS